jgi:hypothetical protein
MQITRTETPTGGPNRTPREEITQLVTGNREVEPEVYLDFSGSESWPWESDSKQTTWDVQLAALRGFIVPFEELDSQAKDEQAEGDDEKGGLYTYPFSNRFLPIGRGDDDGDLNSSNFEEKINAFLAKYGNNGKPQGGTYIMAAIQAADEHFLGTKDDPGEFFDTARSARPVRARVVFTDGILNDSRDFKQYLSAATVSHDGFGQHGEWDEVWAIAILGEGTLSDGSNPGRDAYNQYVGLSKDHAWIHPYYFEKVVNPDEIAEDMAVAVVPASA